MTVVFALGENRDDVGVAQAGHRLGLGPETPYGGRPLARPGPQHFQGDFTLERYLPRAIYGPHAAASDLVADFEVAQASPGAYVVGNFHPVDVLLKGTPGDVRRACRRCEQEAAGFDNFILAPGCEVPPATPVENYEALLQFGWKARVEVSS